MSAAPSDVKNDDPARPIFNTLAISLYSDGQWIPLTANSREPTAFETDLFKGHALMVIRTDPPDPAYAAFFQKKATFEIQVQGKFKRVPAGEIYCGGEGTEKFELGMFTRSVCKAILKFVGTMVSNTHYSFGDSADTENYELPHLVAPLFPTMDKILVTPAGEIPPPLGTPFVEDLEFRKHRLKTRYIAECRVELDKTYSLSVNTANLDLPEWDMVGVPMIGKYDLRGVFGNGSIRFVAYEASASMLEDTPDLHPQTKLKYMFGIKTTPISPNDYVDYTQTTDPELPIQMAVAKDSDSENGSVNDDDDEEEGDSPDEKEEQEQEQEQEHGIFSMGRRTKISNWIRRKVGQNLPEAVLDVPEMHGEYLPVDTERELEESTKYCPACIEITDARNPSRRRIVYLIPWVAYGEGSDSAPTGTVGHSSISSTIKGMFVRGKTLDRSDVGELASPGNGSNVVGSSPGPNKSNTSSGSSTGTGFGMRLRTYRDFASLVSLPPIPRKHKHRRCLLAERRRRQLIETMKNYHKSPGVCSSGGITGECASIAGMLNPKSLYDNKFLGEMSTPVKFVSSGNPKGSANQMQDGFEGHVLVALSQCHWSQEYMKLNKAEISFIRNENTRRARVVNSVPLSAVLSVRPCAQEDHPFAGSSFGFFDIETLNRVYTVMVPTVGQLKSWIDAFVGYLGPGISSTTACADAARRLTNEFMDSEKDKDTSKALLLLLESEHPYIAKPINCWKLNARRLFNHRKVLFNPYSSSAARQTKSPCDLIEGILQKILILVKVYRKSSKHLLSTPAFFRLRNASTKLIAAETTTGDLDAVTLWIDFMNELSMLQTVNVGAMKPREKFCFMLNLYHTMVLHGCFILGPPTSWATWNSFFSTVTYLVGYDVISILELEHNVLRKAMSKPLAVISKLSLPQSQYPLFAIPNADFRLNMCLNNGSESMCRVIPIYRSATVDAQLDIMTSMYLNEVVQVDVSRRIITLPKICAWFLNDFAPMKNYSSVGVEAPLSNGNTGSGASSAAITPNSTYYGETHAVSATTTPNAHMSSGHGHVAVSATTMHCLVAIVPYLQDDLKWNCIKLLTEHLASNPGGQSGISNLNQTGLTIKFHPYTFKCRRLEQYQYS